MKLVLGIIFIMSSSVSCEFQDDFSFTASDIEEILTLVAQSNLTDAEAAVGNDTEKIQVSVAEEDVTFRFFSKQRSNVNGTIVYSANASILHKITDFDTNLKTVFVIHGWKNNCTESSINKVLRKSFFFIANINLFSVCWDDLSKDKYTVAQAAVPQVGRYLAEFIQNISDSYDYPLSNFKLVGHSLGAHISGYAGKQLKGRLPHIVGLDPAAPLYSIFSPSKRLNDSDAEYVEVIHTSGALLGVAYSVGDVDYWPNGGLAQPGCGVDISTSCSHSRAYYLYSESLTNNTFLSKRCSSYETYLLGTCRHNDHSLMGGYLYNTSSHGNYHLKTASSSPFGLGDVGL